jgi:hypothetical protein
MSIEFEMANADDPKDIISASQRSVVKLLRDIISEVKESSGQPGLTWSQIDYLLDMAEKKEPTVVFQKGEM